MAFTVLDRDFIASLGIVAINDLLDFQRTILFIDKSDVLGTSQRLTLTSFCNRSSIDLAINQKIFLICHLISSCILLIYGVISNYLLGNYHLENIPSRIRFATYTCSFFIQAIPVCCLSSIPDLIKSNSSFIILLSLKMAPSSCFQFLQFEGIDLLLCRCLPVNGLMNNEPNGGRNQFPAPIGPHVTFRSEPG